MNLDGFAEAMEDIEASSQQMDTSAATGTAPSNGALIGTITRKRRQLTSRQWRKKLREMMDEESLHSKARFYVYFLGTVFSSQRQLLRVAATRKKSTGSMEAALRFIAKRCKQHTFECSEDDFPFTHITTSNPSLAALIWKLKTKAQDRTIDKMVKHQWFGHLNLCDELQREHKAYEEAIFSIMPASLMETLAPFRAAQYLPKAADAYPLLSSATKVAFGGTSKITREQLAQWLRS